MIKKIFCLATVATLMLTVSCKKEDAAAKVNEENLKVSQATGEQAGKLPTIKFEEETHDFGTINEGDKVETVFKFKNEGEANLLIIDAKGSCGCTVPEFPKEPVAPGQTGEIKVSFDSHGKPGQQQKTVTLTTNTAKGSEQINIKASVTPKAGGATATN
ncbi:DUF1573 domain-containing protein [Flavobacterium sp. '19STA2R22 D10 B1']|uniref:DUF1573 domain-containing protein n=1 Tax=Flavobacterium aerium TaxID=3037261 RepID=UPI00278BF537|nr:DUF1573 domain-containing protein [Flavobacterium sp. '19STA2R22 D10 B1']